MIRSPLKGALVAMLFLWGQIAWADAISGLVDFNVATDLNKFNLRVNSQPIDYFAAGGVNNSGSIRVSSPVTYPTATLVYNERSFNMAGANKLMLSTMFRYETITELSNGGGVGTDVAALHLFTESTPAALSTHIRVAFHETQFSIGGPVEHDIDVFSLVGGSGNGQGFSISPLTDGNWYRLTTIFSIVGGPRNRFDVALEDMGTSGASAIGVPFQTSYTADAGMTFFQDTTAWAAFSTSFPNGAGAERVDNFTYHVPEPATSCLLAVAMACLGLRIAKAGRT
ncbi:MAG: hypothetical protein AB7O59_13090 [Pirellulales bacterium]